MPDLKKLCPNCDKEHEASAEECPHCKFNLLGFAEFGQLMDAYNKTRKPTEPKSEKKKSLFNFGALGGKK
jgi:predicted amidophosphoribosyltransferase